LLKNVLPATKSILKINELIKEGVPYNDKWARFDSAMSIWLKVNYPGLNVAQPDKVSFYGKLNKY